MLAACIYFCDGGVYVSMNLHIYIYSFFPEICSLCDPSCVDTCVCVCVCVCVRVCMYVCVCFYAQM